MLVYYGINSITSILYRNTDEETLFVTTSGGEQFLKYTSLSLEEFSQLSYKNIDKLIICSMFVEEIFKGLCKAGFPNEKVYFYNCTSCKIEPIVYSKVDSNKHDYLLAVYDLSTNLASYDVINFLVLAEAKRRQLEKSFIKLIIVPNRSNQQSFLSNLHHKDEDLSWRISHIIAPLAKSVPSIINVTELLYREDFFIDENIHLFPEGYSITSPKHQLSYANSSLAEVGNIKLFSPAKIAAEIVQSFTATRENIVTITLREYKNQPERNSNLEATVKFCNYLKSLGFSPVVIRDTYTCGQTVTSELAQFCCFSAASVDLDIRLALYQASFLNISVNTGPCYLFYFTKGIRSIEYRWVDEALFSISKKTMEQAGYQFGKQPSFADGNNLVFWGKDSFENLKVGFHSFGEHNAN